MTNRENNPFSYILIPITGSPSYSFRKSNRHPHSLNPTPVVLHFCHRPLQMAMPHLPLLRLFLSPCRRPPPRGEPPHRSQPRLHRQERPARIRRRRGRSPPPLVSQPAHRLEAARPAPAPPLLSPLPVREDLPEARHLRRARIRRRLPARPSALLRKYPTGGRSLPSRGPSGESGGPDRARQAEHRGIRLEARGRALRDGSRLRIGVGGLGVGAALGGVVAIEDSVEVSPVDPVAADGYLE